MLTMSCKSCRTASRNTTLPKRKASIRRTIDGDMQRRVLTGWHDELPLQASFSPASLVSRMSTVLSIVSSKCVPRHPLSPSHACKPLALATLCFSSWLRRQVQPRAATFDNLTRCFRSAGIRPRRIAPEVHDQRWSSVIQARRRLQ